MDFLDDIKEESYSDALSSGNLKGKPREELERFISTGYVAAIHVSLCACGKTTRILGNIMHYESGSKGSRRAVALQHIGHFPQISGKHPTTYLGSKTKVCVHCVEAYGFIPDPEAEKRVLE